MLQEIIRILSFACCIRIRRICYECISEGILSEFFEEHKKEIVEMGIYEFNQEVYDRVLREDGEAIGIEKGIKIGKCQGIEIGKESGILSAIENLMDTLKMTAEQAMTVLKVPETEWTKYMDKLKK